MDGGVEDDGRLSYPRIYGSESGGVLPEWYVWGGREEEEGEQLDVGQDTAERCDVKNRAVAIL